MIPGVRLSVPNRVFPQWTQFFFLPECTPQPGQAVLWGFCVFLAIMLHIFPPWKRGDWDDMHSCLISHGLCFSAHVLTGITRLCFGRAFGLGNWRFTLVYPAVLDTLWTGRVLLSTQSIKVVYLQRSLLVVLPMKFFDLNVSQFSSTSQTCCGDVIGKPWRAKHYQHEEYRTFEPQEFPLFLS